VIIYEKNIKNSLKEQAITRFGFDNGSIGSTRSALNMARH